MHKNIGIISLQSNIGMTDNNDVLPIVGVHKQGMWQMPAVMVYACSPKVWGEEGLRVSKGLC